MVSCTLCGLPTSYPIMEGETAFCCPSCQQVSALLRQEPAAARPAVAAEIAAETATVHLGGLWCASCAWLIGEQLQRAPGVVEARISFLQREAQVQYDPTRTTPVRLARRVRGLGYRAWLPGEQPHDEEDAHQTRLLISGVLVMHIMVISVMLYVRELLGAPADNQWLADIFQVMLLFASLPVLLILGLPILRAGLASLLRRRPNTHTLIALGSFSAFALSVRNLLGGTGGVYFDTAAILLFLVAVGRWLELRAQKASVQAVERLQKQVPDEARWLTATGIRTVPAGEVPAGGRVLVRPGERFPVDGLVASGRGDVDESLLTGEPEPVARSAGEAVLAGTINLDGAFEVITTATGAHTLAGQIGHLLHQALWQRAPVERLADRVAAWMVPGAVLLAAGTFAFWSARAGLEAGLIHALSVLLIACPCALGIATPLTLWIGLEQAAESGVLLRNTSVLEQLAGVRHLFFDKTGTLTQRPLHLHAVATEGVAEAAFLERVVALEAPSEHPMAQAIVAAGPAAPPAVDQFRTLPGQGVTASLGGEPLWAGNRQLMVEQLLALSPTLAATAAQWQQQGMTVVYAGWQGRVAGLLGLGETARPEVGELLSRASALGLPVSVLTGDDSVNGARWQKQLGVPVFAALRPQEKVARLRQTEGSLMVGDGLNDGPALAAASVGLAVRQGTDVAQAAADAILLHDDLRLVPWLVALSRTVLGTVRTNLLWAFFYNALGLALAVSGQLQPLLAALTMVASSLFVTGNALRLRRRVQRLAPVGQEITRSAPGAGAGHSVFQPGLSHVDSRHLPSEITL